MSIGPAGTRVTLRHAETLNPDGSLYVANLRTARATDVYTLKGEARKYLEPRFTYHGFRFVEVTGLPGTPTAATWKAAWCTTTWRRPPTSPAPIRF